MTQRLWLLTGVVLGAMAWYLFSNIRPVATDNLNRSRQLRLEHAVMAVEANFGGMMDAGYVSWTPTVVAQHLAKIMTAAEVVTPEEANEMGLSARALPPSLTYLVGKPSGPWQIVLVPDEAAKLVFVEAYGTDLEHPLLVRKLFVPY